MRERLNPKEGDIEKSVDPRTQMSAAFQYRGEMWYCIGYGNPRNIRSNIPTEETLKIPILSFREASVRQE